MTVPNLITTIRIVLAPIFVIYLINDQHLSALIVLVICGVSDGLDGLVARAFNQKSRLGSFLDPIADKILLDAAFIALSIRNFLPPWLTVTVIARDVLILLGVFVLFMNRFEFHIRPSLWSKITTCLQFVTVIAVLAKEFMIMPPRLHLYLFYATALFTIASGLHYMHYWFGMIGEGAGNQKR
ncbi:MAG: CDP-alcohol phosphatidyltransferase family protein [Deltaproteobacteria bacterium]|nr:CDP-alcohol phosphatidyltransferase family protein [Deltaproteobacteria bacterium]